MFSLNRLYASAVLPGGKDYTFWGKGVSQGHSDAIRRIEGVRDARQYTIPVDQALEAVRSGSNPDLSTRQKHTRECFVVAEPGADLQKIQQTIVNMPNYFADYDTTVHFITEEELLRDHAGIPHGGFVIHSLCKIRLPAESGRTMRLPFSFRYRSLLSERHRASRTPQTVPVIPRRF